MTEENIELHAIVHGRVQGVFFRAKTRDSAINLGLTGNVKNLPDGSVEIIAQGSKDNLEKLLKMLTRVAGAGYVSSINKKYCPPTQKFEEFRIIYF